MGHANERLFKSGKRLRLFYVCIGFCKGICGIIIFSFLATNILVSQDWHFLAQLPYTSQFHLWTQQHLWSTWLSMNNSFWISNWSTYYKLERICSQIWGEDNFILLQVFSDESHILSQETTQFLSWHGNKLISYINNNHTKGTKNEQVFSSLVLDEEVQWQ